MGNRETREVNDIPHKVTTKAVERAEALKKKGVRAHHRIRKVHAMPSHKVKHMLTYKALWKGVLVIPVNEARTSQLCWRCGCLNTEIWRRSFRCRGCGLEYNRDLNGAST